MIARTCSAESASRHAPALPARKKKRAVDGFSGNPERSSWARRLPKRACRTARETRSGSTSKPAKRRTAPNAAAGAANRSS